MYKYPKSDSPTRECDDQRKHFVVSGTSYQLGRATGGDFGNYRCLEITDYFLTIIEH